MLNKLYVYSQIGINFVLTHRKWMFDYLIRRPYLFQKYYLVWVFSIIKKQSPMHIGLPWLSFEAIEFLLEIMHPEMRVFEWGSGGSTLFWANNVEQLVSIEHNRDWYEMLSETYKPNIQSQYLCVDEARYASVINDHSDAQYDLILIDGIDRMNCLNNAILYVAVGGYLVFDNTETFDQKDFDVVPSTWQRLDFLGPYPSMAHVSTTTVFYRPNST